jgi:hypothetical protein
MIWWGFHSHAAVKTHSFFIKTFESRALGKGIPRLITARALSSAKSSPSLTWVNNEARDQSCLREEGTGGVRLI